MRVVGTLLVLSLLRLLVALRGLVIVWVGCLGHGVVRHPITLFVLVRVWRVGIHGCRSRDGLLVVLWLLRILRLGGRLGVAASGWVTPTHCLVKIEFCTNDVSGVKKSYDSGLKQGLGGGKRTPGEEKK